MVFSFSFGFFRNKRHAYFIRWDVIKRFKVFRAGIHSAVDFYSAAPLVEATARPVVSQGLDTTRSFYIPYPILSLLLPLCARTVSSFFSL